MAEILLSLTIIGVVAAITLPSLTGNINERTWNTQRKALFARMSQAISLMPSLNGYGTFEAASGSTSAIDNAAETFITAGLSKVIKMNNICSSDALEDCGLPAQMTNAGGSKVNLPTKMSNLNGGIIATYGTNVGVKNTKAAAFETANGESILTFYNPNCYAEDVNIATSSNTGTMAEGEMVGSSGKQHICVNFIYDLNGSKGPNTVGKDIGTMSVLYSSDSKVVMPMYPRKVSGTKKHEEASKACKDLDSGEYRLPNVEELFAIYTNRLIYGDSVWASNEYPWSSSRVDANTAYIVGYNHGNKYPVSRNTSRNIICVQR
ncbi:MAG: hypothetical protein NC390_05405 [Fusobacterium sp.]|nr:hypothetical protein [Fusobacterium sp.]